MGKPRLPDHRPHFQSHGATRFIPRRTKRAAPVHLTLGDPREGDVVALGETPVYFTEAPLGSFQLRLGWAGFLDRVTFTLYGTLGLFDLERVD